MLWLYLLHGLIQKAPKINFKTMMLSINVDNLQSNERPAWLDQFGTRIIAKRLLWDIAVLVLCFRRWQSA